MIHEKLEERLEFNHNDKTYMHKPEYVFENEKHIRKIFWDFEIQMDPPMIRSELVLVFKKEKKTNLSLSGC